MRMYVLLWPPCPSSRKKGPASSIVMVFIGFGCGVRHIIIWTIETFHVLCQSGDTFDYHFCFSKGLACIYFFLYQFFDSGGTKSSQVDAIHVCLRSKAKVKFFVDFLEN